VNTKKISRHRWPTSWIRTSGFSAFRFRIAPTGRSTNILSLRVALFSSVVGAIAATAAIWLGYEAHVARVLDERPFVSIDVIESQGPALSLLGKSSPSYLDFLASVETRLVSTGKSPALNLHLVCAGEPFADNVKWDPRGKYEEWDFPYLLPNRSTIVYCPRRAGSPAVSNSTDEVMEYGIVYYEDQDHRKYQTPFCETLLAYGPRIKVRTIDCLTDIHLPQLR